MHRPYHIIIIINKVYIEIRLVINKDLGGASVSDLDLDGFYKTMGWMKETILHIEA